MLYILLYWCLLHCWKLHAHLFVFQWDKRTTVCPALCSQKQVIHITSSLCMYWTHLKSCLADSVHINQRIIVKPYIVVLSSQILYIQCSVPYYSDMHIVMLTLTTVTIQTWMNAALDLDMTVFIQTWLQWHGHDCKRQPWNDYIDLDLAVVTLTCPLWHWCEYVDLDITVVIQTYL